MSDPQIELELEVLPHGAELHVQFRADRIQRADALACLDRLAQRGTSTSA